MPLDLCTISGTLFNNAGVAQGGATLFVVKVVKSDTVIWQQQIAADVSDSVTGAVEFAVPRDSTAWISGYFWIGSTDFNVNDGVMVVIPDAATANLEDLGIAVVAPSTYATQTLLDAETAARIAADATKQPLATGTPDGTKFLRDDNSWQPAAGGSAWGGITGTLSAQTDLQALFDAIGPRNAANGYAGLSASGLLTESQIPSSITRDTEMLALTDALTAAVALKADSASLAAVALSGSAADLSSGILATARGGTGIAFFTVAGPSVARVYTFPDANATIARTDAAQTFAGTQTISGNLSFSSGDAQVLHATSGDNLYIGAAPNTNSGFRASGSFTLLIDTNNTSISDSFSIWKNSAAFTGGTELFRVNESGLVSLGGVTSAFPAIKPSATILQGRLADDSDFCPIQGHLRVHANAAAETPTATHTLRVFDAAGIEYRVLAIPV